MPPEELGGYLKGSGADVLVAEAGAVDIPVVYAAQPKLKSLVWVARKGGQDVDWSQPPDGLDGKVDVAVWHQLVESKRGSVSSEVPSSDPKTVVSPLVTVWLNESGVGRLVEYTQDVRIPTLP